MGAVPRTSPPGTDLPMAAVHEIPPRSKTADIAAARVLPDKGSIFRSRARYFRLTAVGRTGRLCCGRLERAGAPGIWLRHVSAALRAGHAEWCCGERGRRLRLRPIGSPRPPTAAKGRDFVMNTKRITTISTFAGALFGSLLVTTALTPVQGADMTQQLRV